MQFLQVEVQAIAVQCHLSDIGTQAADAHAKHLFINACLLYTSQNACWGHPKPFHSAPFRCRLRIPAERFLPGDALRVSEDLQQRLDELIEIGRQILSRLADL